MAAEIRGSTPGGLPTLLPGCALAPVQSTSRSGGAAFRLWGVYSRTNAQPYALRAIDTMRTTAADLLSTQTLVSAFEHAEAHAAVVLGISLAMLIATLIAFPFVILRLPASYFADDRRPPALSRHVVVHWVLMALKNLLGLTLALTGFVLLFLPGQGLLTLIIGLTIMNYPGKFEIERWLVRRPRVLPALNWMRARFGAPPFDDP
jgi:hypothetical protein